MSFSRSLRRRLFFSSPRNDALDRFLEVRHFDRVLPVTRGEQRCFVDDIGQVGSNESGCLRCKRLQIHLVTHDDLSRVHLENRLSTSDIWPIDHDLTIKSSRPQQGGIQNLGSVRCRQEDHTGVGVEAVHLDQQSVERLLPLLVGLQSISLPGLADRVQLINENDARSLLLRLLK